MIRFSVKRGVIELFDLIFEFFEFVFKLFYVIIADFGSQFLFPFEIMTALRAELVLIREDGSAGRTLFFPDDLTAVRAELGSQRNRLAAGGASLP